MVTDEVFFEYLERLSISAQRTEANNSDGEEEQGAAGGDPRGRANTTADMSELRISDEEKQFGWAHKASLVDHLVRFQGYPDPESACAQVDAMAIIETRSVTSCTICLNEEVAAGDGVVLKDCLHIFCK